jgi:DNA-binding MarR family transcriptional regulator
MNKYADLEFLSLADKIAADYEALILILMGKEDAEGGKLSPTAMRALIEIHCAEEPLSAENIAMILRLDDHILSRALIKLVGMDYVRSENVSDDRNERLIHLTEKGVALSQRYQDYMDSVVDEADALSPLTLSDTERDSILVSLISLQNRAAVLLEKAKLRR